MKKVLGMTALLAVSSMTFADDVAFTEAQKKAIQSIVHDYLVSQPEVLIEASTSLQQRQQQHMQAGVQKSVQAHGNQVFQDALTTVGNAAGPVTIVEFFDYQCIHCKKMAPVLSAVMKQDSQVRVIYKEFPIFGKSSILASKAALAAAMQHQYAPMHDALLQINGPLTEAVIMNEAKKLNLDVAKLKQDMSSKTVTDALNANRQLAEALQLMGTPAFIVAATPNGKYQSAAVSFIPGAASEAALMDMVKKSKG